VLFPLQIVGAEADTEGVIAGSTVTVTFVLSLQLPLETTTLYVVVEAGLTLIVALVEPVLHLYVLPPAAVSAVEEPAQTVSLPLTEATSELLTVTVTFVVSAQPAALVPITVYVVVATGLAVTVAPVVALNAVAGLQVYVAPPLAVSATFPPEHIPGAGGFTVTTGFAFTFTVIVCVLLHPAALVPVTV
jgi:hypothetical protein